MATYYPPDDRYMTDDIIDDLKEQIKRLEERNKQLVERETSISVELRTAQEAIARCQKWLFGESV